MLYNNSTFYRYYLLLFIVIIVSFIFPARYCVADDDTFIPWNYNRSETLKSPYSPDNHANHSSRKASMLHAIRTIYQSVSAVDGDRCHMFPTCSEYSIQAIKKHGFFVGFIMTFDRLIHENDELILSPVILSGAEYRIYDPVSNNDFWWYQGGKLDK
jgi:hypothetical protein